MRSTNEQSLLVLDGIDVSYGGVSAVEAVSLSLELGQVVGIVGESGSGKSTILKAIMGLLGKSGHVDSGDIYFDGELLANRSDSERISFLNGRAAYIFQDPVSSLDPLFTVGNQFDEIMRIHFHTKDKAAMHKREMELLADTGFDDPASVLKRYPFELSGGMCQRVVIAMALACEAKLILADEPTSALDVTVQSQVIDLLCRTVRDRNVAMLIVSHNMGVISNCSQMIGVMYAGELVEFGTRDEVLDSPCHPYTRDLIRAIPTIDGQIPRAPEAVDRKVDSPCRYSDRCSCYRPACDACVEKRSLSESHWVLCTRGGEA